MTSSFLVGFEGMWRRPRSDYEKGVASYLVVLDTNVLLELYRFTPSARSELIHVLRRLKSRLWIPHQVAVEYHFRRVDAVKAHLDLFTSTPQSLDELKKKTLQELSTFAKRCSMASEEKLNLKGPIEEAFSKVISEIAARKDGFDLSLERVISEDPVLRELSSLLDKKTGAPFKDEEIESLIAEYERRAAGSIPPGFKDAGKKENAHGDYFVWEQTVREAKARNISVFLVTNDTKEDWVRREAGLIIGARPELIAEFKERCGTDLLVAQLSLFLQIAKESLGAAVSASTVAQAENVPEGSQGSGPAVRLLTMPEYKIITKALHQNKSYWRDRLDYLMKAIDAGESVTAQDIRTAKHERVWADRLLHTWTSSAVHNAQKERVAVRMGPSEWLHIAGIYPKHMVREESENFPERTEELADNALAEDWRQLAYMEDELRDLKEAYRLARRAEVVQMATLDSNSVSDRHKDADLLRTKREHVASLASEISQLQRHIHEKMRLMGAEKEEDL